MTDRVSFTSSLPTTTFVLEGDVIETDPDYGSNGRWRLRFYLRAVNGSASNNFYDSGVQAGRLNNVEFGRTTRDPFLPYAGGGAQRWRVGPFYEYVNANSNGYWQASLTTIQVSQHVVFGNISNASYGSIPMPRIARAPGKPGKPSVSNLTPTGAKFTWAAAPRGNSPITDYGLYVSTSPTFSTHVFNDWIGTGTSYTLSSILAPGTKYYARVRTRNDDGTGVYSDVVEFTTLPATAPGLSVTPSASGTQATVVVTPPSGTTGVTKYRVEIDSSVPGVGTSFELTPPTTSRVISNLTPGDIYQWRASAFYGTYQTPYTSWLARQQPDPNTSPGSYFDGNTTDTADLDYAWTGTANNSTSTTSMASPANWITFTQGVGSTGMIGVVARVRDNAPPAEGIRAARAIFMSDATAPGFRMGTTGADIEGLAFYVGSIWVKSSRATRVKARLSFYDDVGGFIVSYDGDETEIARNVWTRLSVSQQAPPNGDTAGIFVLDTAGTGYNAWQGGDTLTADAAMISLGTLYEYFDGDSLDTPEYWYAWLGTANASTSWRRDQAVSAVDPLADPDCPPIPLPPALPTIESDCIEEVGTWRRYVVVIPPTEVRQWSSTLPTLTLNTGSFAERQVRIRVYANPLDLSPELVDVTTWEAEMILSYIPKNTEIVLDGVTERVWANLSDGRTIPADQLLYGTGGVPATWPELRCGIGYVVTLDVPLEAPSGNLDTSVILTQRM